MTSSSPVFSKTRVSVGKYLKKTCSCKQSDWCFFKFVLKCDVKFSRRHHLHPFSQKLGCRWVNIWRKIVHVNNLDDVSSNLF
jgi:hypothetical protein